MSSEAAVEVIYVIGATLCDPDLSRTDYTPLYRLRMLLHGVRLGKTQHALTLDEVRLIRKYTPEPYDDIAERHGLLMDV